MLPTEIVSVTYFKLICSQLGFESVESVESPNLNNFIFHNNIPLFWEWTKVHNAFAYFQG